MVFVRSLGHRVPAGWVTREFKLKLKLDDEPGVFPLAKDHMIFHFKNEGDCALAHAGGPWFMARQLFVLEPWQPDFVPSHHPIQKMVVWLRLPKLPMEFWFTNAIMAIVAEAGKPLAIDDFTENLKKTRYARVKVELLSSIPLKLGVLLQGRNGLFW